MVITYDFGYGTGEDPGAEGYRIAQDIYYIVEQQFKFIPQAGEEKRKEFDKLLIEKVPGISQEKLDHFRETICGKINSEVKDSQILAPAFDGTKDIADVKEINKVQQTNEQNQVQSIAAAPAVTQ